MHTSDSIQQVPVYSLNQDDRIGHTFFRVYNYEGDFPDQSDLLTPHRKDYYLLVLIRRADSRQWIDMKPFTLKNNTIYFTGPGQVIVKEEFKQLWSTGIAFTKEFLTLNGNTLLEKLPLIQNPYNGHELLLSEADILFVEDILEKINAEYLLAGEWHQRMLGAYLTLLLTYLSRLYNEQFKNNDHSAEILLLKKFQTKINEHFRELHEVGDYASLFNISSGHFSETIKIQSGKPAIKHIHDRLILEARRLLFHTHNSLKEIAFELGFSEASYFSRFFKRETGETPAEYRLSIRKMYP